MVPGGVDRSGTTRVIPCLLWTIERLARRHEVHVFAVRQDPTPDRYRLRGAWVHNIGTGPRAARLLAAIVAEHRRGPFAVLHAVWAWPGMVAGVAGRALGVPVLTHLTGGDLIGVRRIDYGMLRRWQGHVVLALAVRLADRLTVPSDAMRDAARALGIETARLTYGVALDEWPIRPPTVRDPLRPIRLLHVASLNRVKDQPTLLAAAARLMRRGVPFHLDIVGEDTLGGEMQRLARARGLAGHITFHGFLPHRALRPLMERSDLLVHSSVHEADPIVLLEAAVAGVPAVGTAVGHFAEWAPDAAAAVPVGDDRALAQVIMDLARDEPRRMAIARRAQERARARDAEYTVQEIERLYAAIARPDRLTDAEGALRTVLPVFGVSVEFTADDRGLMEMVEERYGAWRRRVRATAPAVRLHLHRLRRDEIGEDESLQHHLSSADRLEVLGGLSHGSADERTGRAVAFIGPEAERRSERVSEELLHALTMFLVTAQNRVPVHGSALRRGSAGIVLTGPSGIGKSTLAYAAARAGIPVLADDAVYIEAGPEPRVWGDAPRIRFRPSPDAAIPVEAARVSLNGETRFVIPADPGAQRLPPFVTSAGICMLTRGAATELHAIDPSEAIELLVETAEAGFDRYRGVLGAAGRVLTRGGAWRLVLAGAPDEALPLLTTMLGAVSSTIYLQNT